MSSGSFRLPGYLAIGGALILGLMLLMSGLPAWRHLRDPATHPLMKRMKSWEDPADAAREVEGAARTPRYKGSGWKLTDGFLIQSTFFSFDVQRLSDLVWAYKKVTKHSINFVPTGKTYEVVLAFHGTTFGIKTSEAAVDEILSFASQKAPWASLGFSQGLQHLFAGRPQEFYAAVEQRKRAWNEKANGA